MTHDTHESPLISASELNTLLGKENIKVFDIRGRWGSPPASGYDDYVKGHIPGAVYMDWTKHFLKQDMPIPLASVASKEQAQKDFDMLGITADDMVILYDDYHHMLAGRLWWAMRYWGLSNVRVLNGGWSYWVSHNLAISKDIPEVTQGNFVATAQDHLRVTTQEVIHRDASIQLIYARGPINFDGDPSDAKTGHIPGAINIPYASLLDEKTKLFKEVDVLKQHISSRMTLSDNNPIISSCGSGYAGTVFLLALKQLGIDASLYDGSFSEWKAQPKPPIEQGSTTTES
jgi:thiosulfate/3-mercaptopyruvate sulfurtransferase